MGFVEDELKQLKDVIGNLDSRIKSLEQRATGSAAPSSTEEIRMLLIGPPGAGALNPVYPWPLSRRNIAMRLALWPMANHD